jgi:hypothetical protein
VEDGLDLDLQSLEGNHDSTLSHGGELIIAGTLSEAIEEAPRQVLPRAAKAVLFQAALVAGNDSAQSAVSEPSDERCSARDHK